MASRPGTDSQLTMFEINEKFEQEDEGNLEHHRQRISLKFLAPLGDKPAKACLQVGTTELEHPVSFRFSDISDMESFIIHFFRTYRLCLREKVKTPEIMKIRMSRLVDRIRKELI